MAIPTLLIHGWSATSASFRGLSAFLQQQGFNVHDINLADYLSLNDEISLWDVSWAMKKALQEHDLPTGHHSFNAIVHSTGGLVVRDFLRQFCRDEQGRPDASRTPIRNLLMLAPANFGSPLAGLGKSMLGRLGKGWRWDGFMETGKELLNALELGSSISYELALRDLFDPAFPIFDPQHICTTVLVGSNGYEDTFKRMMHENGSDGTVRVATANLNAHYLKVDFGNPTEPRTVEVPRNGPDIAFGVLDRNHSTITQDDRQQREDWRRLVMQALDVTPSNYAAHVQDCEQVTRQTFQRGQGLLGKAQKCFHEYMHVVFRVSDQHGNPIPDYFIEFYQEDGDRADAVMQKIHCEILEKVAPYSQDNSYRSFFFDLTDLQAALEDSGGSLRVDMSVVAANLSADIVYLNPPDMPTSGVRVFDADTRLFFRPNRPMLIDLTLYRETSDRVFRIGREE